MGQSCAESWHGWVVEDPEEVEDSIDLLACAVGVQGSVSYLKMRLLCGDEVKPLEMAGDWLVYSWQSRMLSPLSSLQQTWAFPGPDCFRIEGTNVDSESSLRLHEAAQRHVRCCRRRLMIARSRHHDYHRHWLLLVNLAEFEDDWEVIASLSRWVVPSHSLRRKERQRIWAVEAENGLVMRVWPFALL